MTSSQPKNLFACKLGDVRFEDITNFLALSSAPETRTAEGPRVDFKEGWEKDLGATVAAYANSYGGLILLGVTEDRDTNKPTGIPGIERNGELRLRITNHIESSVRPLPHFDVHAFPHPSDPDKDVGIIRVSEGTYPPYMYSSGQSHKVPVRIQNKSRQADYLQLDHLIARRRGAESLTTRDPFEESRLLWPKPPHEGGAGRTATNNFQRVSLMPMQPARLTIDRAVDREFTRAIRSVFKDDSEVVLSDRDMDWVQIEHTVKPSGYNRLWRLSSDGTVAFASEIKMPGTNHAAVYDIAIDALCCAMLARNLYAHLEIQGSIIFGQAMRGPDVELLVSNDERTVDGVSKSPRRGRNRNTMSRLVLDSSELEDPIEVVAESLLRVLQREWAADIDLKRLKDSLDYHADEYNREYGRPSRIFSLRSK